MQRIFEKELNIISKNFYFNTILVEVFHIYSKFLTKILILCDEKSLNYLWKVHNFYSTRKNCHWISENISNAFVFGKRSQSLLKMTTLEHTIPYIIREREKASMGSIARVKEWNWEKQTPFWLNWKRKRKSTADEAAGKKYWARTSFYCVL